jgi:transketolase
MRKTALTCVHRLAQKDDRVVFVGSDVGPGVADEFKEEFPDRFFVEGIAEQYVLGMSAGLALDGFIPYIKTIGTFLTRRCYEQIVVDACLHGLPLRLMADGGGLVYAPLGPTHQAIEDIAIMRCLPNMTVLAPCDPLEAERLTLQTLDVPGPVYLRLAGEEDENPLVSRADLPCELGKAVPLREGDDVLFVTCGTMPAAALEAAEALERDGLSCGVLHFHTIKPLDVAGLAAALGDVRLVCTLEEHVAAGGFGSAVLEGLHALNVAPPRTLRVSLGDRFVTGYGSRDELLARAGLVGPAVADQVRQAIGAGHAART